jgi:poly(A) polymerase
MIKKFIDRLLGKPARAIPLGKRAEIGVAEHGIDQQLLDERAVRVVRTLKDAGHEAYIVGGAVRDLLVGLRPKDFDVATNATPEQVKVLYRRAFIIGRRFRIVHVIFGRGRDHEVIEVSTFRALLDAAAADQVSGKEKTSKEQLSGKSHVVDASGRVLRDNVWGPQIEDAARRDFTVNALYYDPTEQLVVDYHHGLRDAKKRVLRMIGDPVTRYREDPVRIIRVVRFAAKLGFAIDPATRKPIQEMAPLLANVPVSRLFDEMIKLLQTGHALKSLDELRNQGLQRGVFPILDALLDQRGGGHFVQLALADTDRRVAEGRAVAPSFLLACLLWHDVLERWKANREGGDAPIPALMQAVDAVFDARIGDISGRGKLAADMREIWLMQPRFDRRSGSSPNALVEQPRFRAGYDFLRLRADAGEVDAALAEWWEDFSLGSDDERIALLQAAKEAASPRGEVAALRPEDAPPTTRRRRRRKTSAADESAPGDAQIAESEATPAADADADAQRTETRPARRR